MDDATATDLFEFYHSYAFTPLFRILSLQCLFIVDRIERNTVYIHYRKKEVPKEGGMRIGVGIGVSLVVLGAITGMIVFGVLRYRRNKYALLQHMARTDQDN